MNKAISLAIEKGGYNNRFHIQCVLLYDHYFLDPLFWQALGKALGWHEPNDVEYYKYYADGQYEQDYTPEQIKENKIDIELATEWE
jgi:hypothetical protein